MQRDDGSSPNELRPIRFECHYSKYAEGVEKQLRVLDSA
jgi:ribonuclease PH